MPISSRWRFNALQRSLNTTFKVVGRYGSPQCGKWIAWTKVSHKKSESGSFSDRAYVKIKSRLGHVTTTIQEICSSDVRVSIPHSSCQHSSLCGRFSFSEFFTKAVGPLGS